VFRATGGTNRDPEKIVFMIFFKGLYCSVSLYNKQGMYNCSVYQLKNCSLRSCDELAICTAMAAKQVMAVKIYFTLEKTLLPVFYDMNS
jgi:hypothetical protein